MEERCKETGKEELGDEECMFLTSTDLHCMHCQEWHKAYDCLQSLPNPGNFKMGTLFRTGTFVIRVNMHRVKGINA